MRPLVHHPMFWPLVAAPLAIFGILAISGGGTPGVVAGSGLLLGWVLTIPLGRADARSAADPGPRRLLAVAGWGLLAVSFALGGLWLGRGLDS